MTTKEFTVSQVMQVRLKSPMAYRNGISGCTGDVPTA